jgi:hypothetical protein
MAEITINIIGLLEELSEDDTYKFPKPGTGRWKVVYKYL